MKAIVHIGAPKTGSSTIQEFLFRNTSALAGQGFRYHRNVPGRGSQFEYPLAALALIGRLLPLEDEQMRYSSTDLARHQAIGAQVRAELARNRPTWREPVALFSSEHIFPWLLAPDEIAALDGMLSLHFTSVSYVLYIRNHEDLIISEYSELLKRGSNMRIQGLINQRMVSLDWERRVRRWERVVGRDRLDLRLMDRSFLTDGDLLSDFATACGYAMQGLSRLPPENESLTAPAAECLRVLNDRIPTLLHDGTPNPLHEGLLAALMQLSPADAPALALSPKQREQFMDKFAASNERLRADFFPNRTSLFDPPRDRKLVARHEVVELALDMAAQLFIAARLGAIADLSRKERAQSVQRAPNGPYNGIAARPEGA